VAARLDDVLNLVPARLAGLFLVAAASLVPSGDASGAWRAMRRDAGKHRSPNAGWPEAAMAGALGLALGGPRRYAETTVDDPWIGDGRTRATGQDIEAALSVYVAACLINALVVAFLAVL
jgi:adenosylcobinamide-phosphate synthase